MFWRSFFKVTTRILITISLLVGMVVYFFFFFGRGLPNYEFLRHYEPPMMSRIYSADDQVVQECALEKRLFVPIHLIPQRVKDAFLSAEDHNFYYHFGVDVLGTLRAVIMNTLTNSWGNRPVGASTITQQVAKNFLVGNEKSLHRKIREAIVSLRIEYTLPKDRIFELYLNQIYLGSGAYGVAAAALIYFDKDLHELTVDEVAFLAALPKAPSSLTKGEDQKRLESRRNWVIDRMLVDQKITEEEAQEAKAQTLSFKRYREIPVKADYFADEVRRDLGQRFGMAKFREGGFTVRTTLEPVMQQHADQALRNGLIAYDRRHGWRGPLTNIKWEETSKEKDSGSQGQKKDESTVEPWLNALRKVPKSAGLGEWDQAVVLRVSPDSAKIGLVDGSTGYLYLKETLWAAPCLVNQYLGPTPRYMKEILKVGDVVAVSPKASEHFRLEQIPNVTGALVAMDPKTGRVLALTGGYDFDLNQFNCATQARRQPGSCFKPFVYLVGLEKGLTPESKILDAPISISLGRGRGYYTPQNYGHQYLGLCSLKTGLEQSRNVMTVRLAQQVGINRIINCARDFGIMENMPKQIAMVLGAGATTVMRMASAYSAIANGGYKVTPYFVDWVQDRYGETLYNHQSIPQPKTQLASPQSIEQLTNMLIGVTQNGTARSLSDIGFTVAGKTGTTNNYNDAWFVGFTKDVVVAVFVGFPTPRTLGENETGGRVAIPIFRQFMTRIYDGKVTKTFDISPSILSKQTKDISIDEEPYILEDANDKTLQIVANTSEDEVVIYQE